MMLNGAETVNARILDLIQINIGAEQEDFQVKHLVYRVEGTARARGRYLDMRAELDVYKRQDLGFVSGRFSPL